MNVNSMDMTGGLSVKDPSQSQSRLPQWTHPNPMDTLPGAAAPLDQNPSKHGRSERDACGPLTPVCSLIPQLYRGRAHFVTPAALLF